MRRFVAASLLLVSALVALGGCGGDDGGGADAAGASDGGADDTEPALDQSPFCVTIRSLEDMGNEPDSGDGTPEEVLAQNDEIIRLLEDATATAPDDAPADVQSLFDDYMVLSQAITTSGGDTDAAFAALQADEPELMARLAQPDAHTEAFTFFSERCGTAAP